MLDSRHVALEARVAAFEADAWARDLPSEVAGRQVQAAADAACQTALDAPPSVETVRPALVRNLAAARSGVSGRFVVTHLIVPTGLQVRGQGPRTFCGWAFAEGPSDVDFEIDFSTGDVCDKCLPGLHGRVARRRRAIAAQVAASVAGDVSAVDAALSAASSGDRRSRSPARGGATSI